MVIKIVVTAAALAAVTAGALIGGLALMVSIRERRLSEAEAWE